MQPRIWEEDVMPDTAGVSGQQQISSEWSPFNDG